MPDTDLNALAAALQPIISRVRTDVTCIKKEGAQAWTREALTAARLIRHLKNETARGVCPIKAGESTTQVALLDLDSHKGESSWAEMAAAAEDICATLEIFGLQCIPFRSSGGRGIHLFMLWDAPQDAYSVRRTLVDALDACGFKNGAKGVAQRQVEVFPKQDAVATDGFGNQFILPLAGESVPLERVLGFEPMDREYLLDIAWPISDPVQQFEKPARNDVPALLDTDLTQLKEALDAIPNKDDQELDYDDWRNIIFGIHSATGGSDTGRFLAQEFSARSSKYDPEFLDNRVWPYITDRDGGISARTVFAKAREFGWVEDVTDDFDLLPPLTREQVAQAAREHRTIPQAYYLTTDQANAERLVNIFKSRLLASTDRWFAWTGTHWAQDDRVVYECGLKLSLIVRNERDAHQKKAEAALKAGKEDDAASHLAYADALEKWARKCEMRTTIDAALYLAKRMLAVPADRLDRDPWALNCRNGTVDLRTGILRPHNPADYITRCIDLEYDPKAAAPLFESVLSRVTLEDGRATKPIANFLQRWFGYCATGDTREQKFVVHYGTGRNGKSTVLDIIANVLGDYAGTAAPGLLVQTGNGNSERHPTEVADLFGRRMVTAHETNDGAVLREGFIKWATGSDRIKARYMRADFFEFDPTHKMQLLTNHKPIIRGQDEGIWRRVLLVPFLARFGSPEEVANGTAMYLRDTSTAEQLLAETQGVLAWVVRGAVEWFAEGLNPPDSVLAASKDYQTEQDRMLQFVKEYCELGHKFETPLSGEFGGIFPAYQAWAEEGGYRPLSKVRFLQELERVVPGFRKHEGKVALSGGRRKSVTIITGIKLLDD